MGLFSKKQQEPLTYAEVERTVHVPARLGDVVAHLAAYGELWSRKRAEPHEVMVAEVGGWTAVRLPEAVHPWQLHNLGYWMLDCPNSVEGLVCESGAGPGHAGYRLVRDPEVADALCGWTPRGRAGRCECRTIASSVGRTCRCRGRSWCRPAIRTGGRCRCCSRTRGGG